MRALITGKLFLASGVAFGEARLVPRFVHPAIGASSGVEGLERMIRALGPFNHDEVYVPLQPLMAYLANNTTTLAELHAHCSMVPGMVFHSPMHSIHE
jgi:hypothetical protein